MNIDHKKRPLFGGGIIWGLICLLLYAPLQAQEQHAFNLDQAINYGLEHNKDLQNARFDIYIAERRAKEMTITGLPQVDLQADVINNFKLPVFIIPFPDPATGETVLNQAQFGLPWQGSAGATLSQLVFDGTYFLGLKAAKEFSALSEKNLSRTQEETALAIAKSYYQAMMALEMLDLLDANLERVTQLYEETKILNQEGFAEKIDVERLQINSTNLQLEKAKVARAAQLSIDMLKFQMGMNILDELTLTENIGEIEVTTGTLETLADFSFAERIEYQILENQKSLETYNMRRYKAGYLPSIYGFANYSVNSQWDSDQSFTYDVGSVGLRLNFSIFDGLRKRHQVMQSKLALKKIDNNFITLENSIRLELKSTHNQLVDAYNNLDVYKQNRNLAEKVFNVTQIKYKEGVGSSLELNDAESELKQSESSYLNALFEYLMAKVSYDKARGKFSVYHQ